VPLLGLPVSDQCINKIIPSDFLMSVVFWILFQMAGEPTTPEGTRVLSNSQLLECGAADAVGWHL